MIYANIIVLNFFGMLFVLGGSNWHSRLLGAVFIALGLWNAASLFIK